MTANSWPASAITVEVPAELSPCPFVLLVRHTEVTASIRQVCYGRSDVPLSSNGVAACAGLAEELRKFYPDQIFHSGLARTRFLADVLGQLCGLGPREDVRIRELDFGDWEMRNWGEIYEKTGSEMDRILAEPHAFAPGGGETLFQLRDRMLDWLAGLGDHGAVVAVTHGGPISVLCGTITGAPVAGWPQLVPGYGESVVLRHAAAKPQQSPGRRPSGG